MVGMHRMVDTVAMARMRHPGAKHSLDALCNRYGIDRSHRTVHGALLDAQLLSQVYVELTGGRQIGLGLVSEVVEAAGRSTPSVPTIVRPPRVFAIAEAELARHARFMTSAVNPLWGAI